MLKITISLDLASRLGDNDDEVLRGRDKADDKNLSKKSKNIKSGIQMGIGATGKPIFLTPGAKEVFN